MTKNNLKPEKKILLRNLDQYRQMLDRTISDIEFASLGLLCYDADQLMRKVSKIAVQKVPSNLKNTLVPHLTADKELSPKATILGERDAYRIAMPISLLHRLMMVAPKRIVPTTSLSFDYYSPTTLIAVLAAYAHELNHVFIGHLETDESIYQETHADYMGGALTWLWLRRDDIQKTIRVSSSGIEDHCAYAFLHLVSLFGDNHTEKTLPRLGRLLMYCGGAAFAADKKMGPQQGALMQLAQSKLPVCPDQSYTSDHINEEYAKFQPEMTEGLVAQVASVINGIPQSKREWYNASIHLKPIKKDLQRVVKFDMQQSAGRKAKSS